MHSMKRIGTSAILLGSAAICAPASAQHFPFDQQRAEQRVSVGVTIPLGGDRSDRADRAPRLEVRSSYRSGRANLYEDTLDPVRRPDVERRVGISLTEEPNFYVDGRAFDLREEDPQLGVSTAVVVVGAVVLVGVAIAAASNFNDLSLDRND